MGSSCSCINSKLEKNEFSLDSNRMRDLSKKSFHIF